MTEPEEEEPFFLGDHYLYDGTWYYHKFPVDWAKTHLENTGPKNCMNCAEYGTLHQGTIFLGYCVNCARFAYKCTRGHGFVGEGEESEVGPAARSTYLQDVVLEDIPPLLCDITDDGDDNRRDDPENSVLECHFEGGYNDF